jgi:hypothetical protein
VLDFVCQKLVVGAVLQHGNGDGAFAASAVYGSTSRIFAAGLVYNGSTVSPAIAKPE